MPVLRIVTQNIWNKNDHWQKRADAIGRNMDELEVDIVCIQESMPDHFEYLTSHSFSRFPHAYYAPSDDATVTSKAAGIGDVFTTARAGNRPGRYWARARDEQSMDA